MTPKFHESFSLRNSNALKEKNEKVTLGTKIKKEQNFDSFAWGFEKYLQAIYPFILIGYVQLQKKVGGTLGEKQTEVYLIKALNWQFSKKKLSELKKFRREYILFHDREQIWPNS